MILIPVMFFLLGVSIVLNLIGWKKDRLSPWAGNTQGLNQTIRGNTNDFAETFSFLK